MAGRCQVQWSVIHIRQCRIAPFVQLRLFDERADERAIRLQERSDPRAIIVNNGGEKSIDHASTPSVMLRLSRGDSANVRGGAAERAAL